MIKKLRVWMIVGAGIVALVWASPVSADAQIESSSPSPSAVLESAPTEIVLNFNEPVTSMARSIEIYNQAGQRIVVGEALNSPDDARVLVAGDVPAIPDGLYVVAWRVVSDDGHVADGAYTFQIGIVPIDADAAVLIARAHDGKSGPTGLVGVMALARFLGFLGLCLTLGSLALICAGGVSSRRNIFLVASGWVMAFVGTLTLFLLQGPYTVAGTWSDMFTSSLWSDVRATRIGQAMILRLVLLLILLLLLALLRGAFHRSLTIWWRSATTLVGIAIVLTHSSAGRPSASGLSAVAIGVDALHLGATILWLGGLVVVGCGAVLETSSAEVVVSRFSRLSTAAIAVVVATGLWQTWHLVPVFSDISSSDWGKSLLIKTVLVIALVTCSGIARWLIHHDLALSLRRLVLVEVILAVSVLGVTGFMVAKSPSVPSESAVVAVTLTQENLFADVVVTPGRVGNNEIHLTLSSVSTGSFLAPQTVTMRLSQAGSEVPAIAVPVTNAGADHYLGAVSILFPGIWTLEIIMSPDSATSSLLTTQITIVS